MADKKNNEVLQGSLFEKDYLVRSLGAVVISPEVALTELVANCWDAGATNVFLTIPQELGEVLEIRDNGIGMTHEQFLSSWMKLGYNRLAHQGNIVKFPKGVDGNRYAYGRNGIGRHGMLCFNSEYSVTTNHDGNESTFTITTKDDKNPFVIKDYSSKKSKTLGTSLKVVVEKHLPSPEKILDIISSKFLHDPNFKVFINNKSVQLEELAGFIDKKNIDIDGIQLTAYFIDTQKVSRKSLYQGVAFWQRGRLVGEPNWVLDFETVVDGRTTFAKKYSFVIQTNDLSEQVFDDWTGFKQTDEMQKVYAKVKEYIFEMISLVSQETIIENKQYAKLEFANEISKLSSLGKYEVNEVIETIIDKHPTAKQESISIAVDAVINLEKTRSGKELLLKLSNLNEHDISGLNKLLDKWSVRDALTVLEEIDNRISVIEAIRKFKSDKEADELHILHPLVTKSRWLFGPEFESAEFSSNSQLQTAVEKVFKKKIDKAVFDNHKKRPDLVILQNSSISVTGTETFESDSMLSQINKVLIIELKRGGFKLSREERNQAMAYVEDFSACGAIIGSPYFEAFVIGNEFDDKVQPTVTVKNENDVERGRIRLATFGQIIDTAEKRLFGLRKKLNERYDDFNSVEYLNQQGFQIDMNFTTPPNEN